MVPPPSHLFSACREGTDGGRLAVQVEDKLVKVRNIKVSPLLLVPFLSRERRIISRSRMFITLRQPSARWMNTHTHVLTLIVESTALLANRSKNKA